MHSLKQTGYTYRAPTKNRTETPIFLTLDRFNFHITQWGAIRMVRSDTTLITPEATLYFGTSILHLDVPTSSGGHWNASMKVPIK